MSDVPVNHPWWKLPPADTASGTPTFELHAGEVYGFNFAGSPGGQGTFLGWTSFGYIAIDKGGDDGIAFYNPALLCTLRPETYPPEA